MLAHAKINLGLKVVRLRPDSYHDLETVMLKLRLADRLTVSVEPLRSGQDMIEVTTDDPAVPGGAGNLAHRSAALFLERARIAGAPYGRKVIVRIEKKIPAGAGLGGGSSDAASVLLALGRISGGVLADPESLRPLAARIGSDVPFFLGGPVALACGRGDRLTPVAARSRLHVLCAMPRTSLSTKAVYAMYDIVGSEARPDIQAVLRSLESGRIDLLRTSVRNDLQEAATAMVPEIRDLVQQVESHGAVCACMTGSGSSIFGVFPDGRGAASARDAVSEFPFVSWCQVTESLTDEVLTYGS